MIQKFVLTYNSVDEILTINPDGWKENGQMWKRSRKYHGVFQSYSATSYRFARIAGGGGDTIKAAYDADGIKADVTVTVYDRNPQTDDWDLSYIGKLNFDPDKYFSERDFVEVGFVANSNIQKFITRDELEIDINSLVSVDGVTMNAFSNSPKQFTFKKIDIQRQVQSSGNFENTPGENVFYSLHDPATFIPPFTDVIWLQPETIHRYKYYAGAVDINETGSSFLSESGPSLEERSLYFYENGSDQTVEIVITKCDIGGNITDIVYSYNAKDDEIAFILVIEVYDADDVLQSTTEIDSYLVQEPYPDFPTMVVITFNGDDIVGESFELQPEWKIAMTVKAVTNLPESWDELTHHSIYNHLEIEFDFYENALSIGDTTVSGYYPYEAFARMFQLITSNENTFDSVFLGRGDSEFITHSSSETYQNIAITNGWNIRSFPDRPLNLKLSDLFKTFDGIFNLMLSYDHPNDRFYIEQKAEAFKSDTIIYNIGEVTGLKIRPFKEAYFNEILGGYDTDGNYEQFQGANEFISQFDYSVEMPVKETLDIRIPYNADSIMIELTRRKQYSSYASEDTDGDDMIFIAKMNQMGITEQGDGAALEGFPGIEQRYNIKLTARENLLRWASYIKASQWKETDFTIRFRKSKKGIDMTYTNANGDTVTELSDIPASEIADIIRLFNPEIYEFESIFNLELNAAIEAEPHGLILFEFENIGYAGFIEEIQTQDYNQKATYKLIAYDSASGIEKLFEDSESVLFEDGEQVLFD